MVNQNQTAQQTKARATRGPYPLNLIKLDLTLFFLVFLEIHQASLGGQADRTPSKADKAITLTLQHALATVGIKLLDHLILGSDSMVSLAEEGLL